MKRTPMNRGTSTLQRKPFVSKKAAKIQGTCQISQVGKLKPTPRARRSTLKPKKIPPTAEEGRWMAAVVELGCAVCLKFHQVKTPAAVHHIVEGGRRLGHFYTLPLCDPGHHQNTPTSQKISRHPNKARFEKQYGSEYELLEYVQTLLNWKPI